MTKPLPHFVLWCIAIPVVIELLIPTGLWDRWYWGTTVAGIVVSGCLLVGVGFIAVTYGDYD